MTISYLIGDATVPQLEGNKIIVHVCNDIGKWGRGFVMALSKKWPQTRKDYLAWFNGKYNAPFALGEVQFVAVEADLWVANMIGQHGISRRNQNKPPIRYEAIRSGLQKITKFANKIDATIHMPRIGSGLADGKWERIEGIIKEEMSAQGVSVFVYDLA